MKRNLNPLLITQHASQRLQQRGIKVSTLSLLHEFGRRVYNHKGAFLVSFDHAARRQVEAALGKAAQRVNFGAYAVIDALHGTRVITVGHRLQRIREYA